MAIWIDVDLCDVCGSCVRLCPYDAMIISDSLRITNRCTECELCVRGCKKEAIKTNCKSRCVPDFSEYRNIWVFVEYGSNGIKSVSLEILNKAHKLASLLGQKVIALILGHDVSSELKILGNFGADEVFVIDDEILKSYDTKLYASIIKNVVESRNPNIFLFGATYVGRDLAPRVAALLKVGLTADCTDLSIDLDEKILIQTRPAFGGDILATILNRFSRPQMATVRAGVFFSNGCCRKKVQIKFLPCDNIKPATKVLKSVKDVRNVIELSKAKIIVAGGRGMESNSGFDMIYILASLLGGEVAGTRVAVENGWITEQNQIGQTGQTVRPDLYVACGISGAIQHRAGMANSKYIVAINNDIKAPIFNIANWGIVGNVFDVLSEMIKQIKAGV